MKIKSLLLGSAAALVAVSGAQAADAIIVEPEPMEYVKVCDMYGAGFFYIPGTETCLRISGHVRTEYSVATYHEVPENANEVSHHNWRVRGQLSFTAQNETEYGTLGSDIVIRAGWLSESAVHDIFSVAEGHSGGMTAIKATINLAGFRTGYDSDGGGAWNRYGGYGYYNARFDGNYLFDSAIFFEYGGSAGGVNYVVGIQDGASSGASGAPDVYAGMTGTFGGLGLRAVVMYDNNGGYDDSPFEATGAGGIAYRIRADYDLSSMIAGGSIGAWWESDSGQTDYVKGHRWGVTMQAALADKWTLFGGYSEYDTDEDAWGGALTRPADSRDWTVGVRWAVVSGLYVQAEWNKTQCIEDNCFVGPAAYDQDSRDRFNLRIHRSF